MVDSVDVVVIGAGVVGLACARAIAQSGKEVLVLEKEKTFGLGISGRNSEVIHAGIYYAPGSLKSTMCVRGRELLYEFCHKHNVPNERIGKLIVATETDHLPALEKISDTASLNSVNDVRFLTVSETLALEPNLHFVGALLSPSSGILDARAFMLALLGDAERHGAVLAVNNPIYDVRISSGQIFIRSGPDPKYEIGTSWLINSAGLHAQSVARLIDAMPVNKIPAVHYAKGNYFYINQKSPFKHLIYPIPEAGGLGIHLTLDLAGRARFGPDVEWQNEINYLVNPQRAEKFYREIRRYWPGLPDGALQPGYAGIRPKLVEQGRPDGDFVVQTEENHGVAGLINLFGIESPGLTASLAIAEQVLSIIET